MAIHFGSAGWWQPPIAHHLQTAQLHAKPSAPVCSQSASPSFSYLFYLLSLQLPQAHLLEAALALAWDPVPNVRLHLAGALPGLKGTVGLPDDVHLLELLNRWGVCSWRTFDADGCRNGDLHNT